MMWSESHDHSGKELECYSRVVSRKMLKSSRVSISSMFLKLFVHSSLRVWSKFSNGTSELLHGLQWENIFILKSGEAFLCKINLFVLSHLGYKMGEDFLGSTEPLDESSQSFIVASIGFHYPLSFGSLHRFK